MFSLWPRNAISWVIKILTALTMMPKHVLFSMRMIVHSTSLAPYQHNCHDRCLTYVFWQPCPYFSNHNNHFSTIVLFLFRASDKGSNNPDQPENCTPSNRISLKIGLYVSVTNARMSCHRGITCASSTLETLQPIGLVGDLKRKLRVFMRFCCRSFYHRSF